MPRVLQFPLLPLAQTTGTNASYCPRYHPFIANHLWHEYYYPSNWPDYNFYQHFIIVHPFTFENDPLPRLIANICLSSVYLSSYLLVDWWLRIDESSIINDYTVYLVYLFHYCLIGLKITVSCSTEPACFWWDIDISEEIISLWTLNDFNNTQSTV